MCDTLCVLPSWSSSGHTLFAKNSDRDPNEPHVIVQVPARAHEQDSGIRCTYIDIPQVAHTFSALLLKPDWIWGAEMGVNEHGVAIGNEAVFTRGKKEKEALTGMDLLRLALERADSAEAALNVIVDLLAKYGQGGNCGYSHDFRYDNSFLIADPKNAFVLETSGRSYAAHPVPKAFAISNRLVIGREHTMRRGISENLDFARAMTEPVFSYFAQGAARRAQSLSLLERLPMDVAGLISILRTHSPKLEGQEFARPHVGSVCMHGGGRIGDHTTGSFVAVLRQDAPVTVWATGASTPCISAFKPVFFGSGIPVYSSSEEGRAYWLERERLHRAVLAGRVDVKSLRERRDGLEAKWKKEEEALFATSSPSLPELREFSGRCAAEEQAMVDEFSTKSWAEMSGRGYFANYWRSKNAVLGANRASQ